MNRYRKLINNSIIFAIGNLGSKLVQFFLVPLYSFTMTTSAFGKADFLSQIVFLMTPIVSLELFDAAFRFALDKTDNTKAIFNSSFFALIFASFITFTVALIISPFLKGYYIVTTAFFLVSNIFFSFFSNFIRAIGYVKNFAIAGIVNTFAMGLSNVLFLVILKLGLEGYLLAYSIGLIVGNVYIIVSTGLLKYVHFCYFKKKKLIQMLAYSLPLIPNYLGWWFNSSSDRFFIIGMIGSSANGIYAMANKIPNFISVLAIIFSQSWQISIVEEFQKKDSKQFVSHVFTSLMCLLLLSGCLIMAFIKPFYFFALNKTYRSGWYLTPILILAAIYCAGALFMEGIYTAYKQTVSVFLTTSAGAIVNVILTVALIPILHLYGASLANVVSFLLVLLLRLRDIMKINQIELEILRITVYHLIFALACLAPIILPNMVIASAIDCFIVLTTIVFDRRIRSNISHFFKK